MSSSKLFISTLIAITASLSIMITVLIVDQAHAAKYPYAAPLSGGNEVPPTESTATGESDIAAPSDGSIKYRINITGISNASAVQINMAKAGENGDVVADLLNTPTSKHSDNAYGMILRGNITDSGLKGPMQGKTVDDLAAAMDAGDTYVNVLTVSNPDGEIRGQIINEDMPSAATNDTVGVGFSTLTE